MTEAKRHIEPHKAAFILGNIFILDIKFLSILKKYRSREAKCNIGVSFYFLAHNDATEPYNTSIKWEFCQLSEFVRFLKLELLIKSTH